MRRRHNHHGKQNRGGGVQAVADHTHGGSGYVFFRPLARTLRDCAEAVGDVDERMHAVTLCFPQRL